MPALIEHLRARLGSAAVYGIAPVSQHRPERAWRVADPALGVAAGDAPCGASAGGPPLRRPLWLLHAPRELRAPRGRPRHHGRLELLAGPERIESGWWDGGDVQRDYYVAKDSTGSQLWVYRECAGARRWFLHGIFG
jgi:protein ImuB